jgi:hypothetical protein
MDGINISTPPGRVEQRAKHVGKNPIRGRTTNNNFCFNESDNMTFLVMFLLLSNSRVRIYVDSTKIMSVRRNLLGDS